MQRIKAETWDPERENNNRKEVYTMYIYKNRYQASKDKRAGEVIVKVCGGYVIMTADQYFVWRGQK